MTDIPQNPNPYPYKNLEVNPFYMKIAQNAYSHYGAVTDFKNFQGNPMPKFADLPDTIKKAWHDAARYCYSMGNNSHRGVIVFSDPELNDDDVRAIQDALNEKKQKRAEINHLLPT